MHSFPFYAMPLTPPPLFSFLRQANAADPAGRKAGFTFTERNFPKLPTAGVPAPGYYFKFDQYGNKGLAGKPAGPPPFGFGARFKQGTVQDNKGWVAVKKAGGNNQPDARCQ